MQKISEVNLHSLIFSGLLLRSYSEQRFDEPKCNDYENQLHEIGHVLVT